MRQVGQPPGVVGVVLLLAVGDDADWERAFAVTLEKFGRLDVLVNNAGTGAFATVEETSIEDVYACGDVACHYNTRFGARLRLESWENAQNQAIAAASSMCGEPAHYDPAPWFWTNQFDINMQIAGVAPGWDERVIRGEPDSGKFMVFYLAEDRLVACSAANNAREMRSARTLLEHNTAVSAAVLSDPETDLKALAAEAGA